MTRETAVLRDRGLRVRLAPRDHLAREVMWGHCWQVGTPAYWIALTRENCQQLNGGRELTRHRLGADLAEEIAVCVLGGYGIPHKVALAAFDMVKRSGALDPTAVFNTSIVEVLQQPLQVGGREIRYRFAVQRSSYLQSTLMRLREDPPPSDALGLRRWLLACRGIGPKTASWIVRNHLGSSEVAIIDIHVFRAGVVAGVFDAKWSPSRHYEVMEALFLAWAHHGQVSAADLDAVIWSERARWPGGYAMMTAGQRVRA